MSTNNKEPRAGRPDIIRGLGSPETLKRLAESEVIIGVDEITGNEFLMYGRDAIGKVVATIESTPEGEFPLMVIRIPILQATQELEALCAATAVSKGHHEYVGSGYAVTDGSTSIH